MAVRGCPPPSLPAAPGAGENNGAPCRAPSAVTDRPMLRARGGFVRAPLRTISGELRSLAVRGPVAVGLQAANIAGTAVSSACKLIDPQPMVQGPFGIFFSVRPTPTLHRSLPTFIGVAAHLSQRTRQPCTFHLASVAGGCYLHAIHHASCQARCTHRCVQGNGSKKYPLPHRETGQPVLHRKLALRSVTNRSSRPGNT
jgi:hypothetical protein